MQIRIHNPALHVRALLAMIISLLFQFPVPEEIVRLMAETFDEEKGRAWEHFATGLGWNRR